MREIKIQIKTPDDEQNKFYNTVVKSDLCVAGGTITTTIYGDMSQKDPLNSAMKKWFKGLMKKPRMNRYGFSRNNSGNIFRLGDFDGILFIKDCPFALSRKGGKYRINGKAESIATISSALAKVLFKSCFTDDNAVLMKTLFSSLDLPEDIKYALENRIPYHFYQDFEKQQVRLNVAQIDDKMFAIEIGDGVWGNITLKDLLSFCGFYIHGRENSKFKRIGLKRLYTMLMDKEPRESDVKMMKAFLMQNRTSDIVESKARELVAEMVNNFPTKLKVKYDNEGIPIEMYVKGIDYDWKLSANGSNSGRQAVSTFVRQKKMVVPQYYSEDDGVLDIHNMGEEKERQFKEEWYWSGPICIDNMVGGSSLGDQFCTRALAVMNDNMTVSRVNTIKNYLKYKPNKNERIELDEMS